jgi:predicted metalloprotease with PDZ domain
VIGRDGRLSEVLWGGPAYKAALTIETQIVDVAGTAYRGDLVKAAVTNAKNGGAPIELRVKDGDRFRTVKIDYRGGLRYPRLERDPRTPARLDEIFAARK